MAKLRIVLWIAVAAALCGLGALSVVGFTLLSREAGRNGASLQAGARLGGSFQLVDATGAPVSEAVFRQKPSVTLFGYTHCPDVCPTGLTEMGNWIAALGPDADKLRFVFVTVDPERDTPEAMREYVSAFSDKIVAISGPPEAVHAMVKDYKIYSRRVPLADGDYSMDHTASMILQDADGDFVGTIDAAESEDVGLAKLKRLVAG